MSETDLEDYLAKPFFRILNRQILAEGQIHINGSLNHLLDQILIVRKGIGNMRAGPSYAVIGLVVMGLALLSTISIPVTTGEVVISTSFSVGPSMTYGPYDDDTIYHIRIFGTSALRGEIIIEGVGIYLTVNGEHTQHLKGVFVNDRIEFEIVPAIDQYTFEFNNTNGVLASAVQFTLEEVWTRPVAMSATTIWGMWLGGFLIFMVGFLGFVIVRLRNRLIKTPASNERNGLLST